MSVLSIRNVRKVYGTTTVVKDFDLDVEAGEFISFLGPSGCGKTTTLRMVAGFETPSAGSIIIGGKDVTALPPNQRRIGMVFQSYALFPNMTAAQNVAFGLKVAKWAAPDVKARVAEMLETVKLPHLADRYPYQMSGGQQQRIALARALAAKPQLLLLDEPLSALDAKLRVSLREEIKSLQRNLGITTIFVTHDQEEALSLSSRVVVMNEGRIEQLGTPFEIYNRPRTRFVATFVGTLNIVDASVVDAAQGLLAVGGQPLRTAHPLPSGTNGLCTVAIRPEAVSLRDPGRAGNRLSGAIEDVSFLGAVVRLKVGVGPARVVLDQFNNPTDPPPEPGDAVTLHVAPEDVLTLAH